MEVIPSCTDHPITSILLSFPTPPPLPPTWNSLFFHLQVNYTSPLVAMHFTDVVKNQAVPVQCQLKGKGIINDVINDRFVGRVIFTLNIET